LSNGSLGDIGLFIDIRYNIFKKYFGYIPKKGSCEERNLRLEK